MAAVNEPVLIGIDVGTTTVKAALFDANGRALKTWSSGYPTIRSAPAIVEQNPEDWMAHVLSALEALTDGLTPGRLAGVGLCSQVNTHVFADADGRALMPAIVWQDGRCAATAAELDAQVPHEDRLSWWGAPLPIDASHVLSRIAFVQRHHADIWARTRHVLAPKDFCILRLTGTLAADAMTNFGIVDAHLQPIAALIGLVDGAAESLPPMHPLFAPIGRIRNGLPGAGAAMVTGTMDAWSGLFGAGAINDGDAFDLSGTSEICGIVSPKRVPTPGVIAFAECEGIVLHAGPTQSGGASVQWLSQLLGRSPAELSVMVAGLGKEKPRPMFLPHLQGERAPIWDIQARGVFAGLDASMGPAELARSVYEGVGYSVRWLFDSLEGSAACRPAAVNHAGGGASSDAWCQIRADILQRPIRRMAHLDAGVLGAAILAGVGAKVFSSIPEAVARCVKVDRVFEPDRSQSAVHDERFEKHRALYGMMKPFNAAWASFG